MSISNSLSASYLNPDTFMEMAWRNAEWDIDIPDFKKGESIGASFSLFQAGLSKYLSLFLNNSLIVPIASLKERSYLTFTS